MPRWAGAVVLSLALGLSQKLGPLETVAPTYLLPSPEHLSPQFHAAVRADQGTSGHGRATRRTLRHATCLQSLMHVRVALRRKL